MKQLLLLEKISSDNKMQYKFLQDNKTVILDSTKAAELLQLYPPELRNCKLWKGNIVKKPYSGKLPAQNTHSTGRKVVNIYTKHIYRNKCDIYNNDKWFVYPMYDTKFMRQQEETILRYDGAKIIDYGIMTIATPYGCTEAYNLSTGLKTLLNIKYLKQKYPQNKKYLIYANDCGENMLKPVFDEVCNTLISLYLSYPASLPHGYNIYVNDKVLEDVYTFPMYTEYE